LSTTESLRVEHERFGPIEVGAEEVLRFEGIPGFPEAERFALLRHDRDSAFLWLVSLDVVDLAFAVADPRQFFPDYRPELTPDHLASVEASRPGDIELFAIATIREGSVTLNLTAPVLVNARAARGTQVVLADAAYTTQTPLPTPAQIESKPQT
jgi:flagellar assembly factor FliW